MYVFTENGNQNIKISTQSYLQKKCHKIIKWDQLWRPKQRNLVEIKSASITTKARELNPRTWCFHAKISATELAQIQHLTGCCDNIDP